MNLPILTPAQRRAHPILALVLDCYAPLKTGEPYIDLRPKKEAPPRVREHRDGKQQQQSPGNLAPAKEERKHEL